MIYCFVINYMAGFVFSLAEEMVAKFLNFKYYAIDCAKWLNSEPAAYRFDR